MRRQLPAIVVALAVGLAAAAGWRNAATTDEPYHILAAWSHVVEGKADLNPDKPPLVKLLAGAALAPLGLRGTEHPPVERLAHLPDETRRFLYQNVRPARTILTAARLPQLLFLIALLAAVYVWARELWGPTGALLALVAAAAQPLVLGHAALVHTDVAAAATSTWTLYALFRFLRGARHGWIAVGLCLGLALLAKFSALMLVPIGALLVVLERRKRGAGPALLRYAAACALAVVVVLAGYAPELRSTTDREQARTISVIATQWPGTEPAARALTSLARPAPALAHYGLGLLHLYETDRRGQGVNAFMGKTSTEGAFFYFPVALLAKLTFPFIGLLAVTLALKGRRWTAADAFLLLPAGVLFGIALFSRYNIGARHLLPIVPLLAIWSGQLAAWLSRQVLGALFVLVALPPFLVFPHFISHFSLLAGGSRHGARVLNDSNLDWGQDWTRLADRARREKWTPMAYVYIGPAFPGSDLQGARDYLNEPAPLHAGYYAVSSFAENVGPDSLAFAGHGERAELLRRLLAFLREHGRVVGRIGTSITVYELR